MFARVGHFSVFFTKMEAYKTCRNRLRDRLGLPSRGVNPETRAFLMMSEERSGVRFINKKHTEPSRGLPICVSHLPPPYETLGHIAEALVKPIPQAIFQKIRRLKKKGGCQEVPSKLYGSTVDTWIMWGLGTPTLSSVGSPCTTCSQPSVFRIPLFSWIHIFNQPQIV